MVQYIWDIYFPWAKRSKRIRDDKKAVIRNSCSRFSFSTRNWTSQVALVVKNSSATAGDISDVGSTLGFRKIPWRRAWQPTPVFLPGESHGQSSLTGYIVHGIFSKRWTQLKQLSTHTDTHKILRFCFLAFGNYQNDASKSGLLRPICDIYRRSPL